MIHGRSAKFKRLNNLNMFCQMMFVGIILLSTAGCAADLLEAGPLESIDSADVASPRDVMGAGDTEGQSGDTEGQSGDTEGQADITEGQVDVHDSSDVSLDDATNPVRDVSEDALPDAAGFCGDGFTDPEEACDDGNGNDQDGCRSDCTVPICGDGIVDLGEQCDFEGQVNDERCDENCQLRFATLNPADRQRNIVLSNSNLTATVEEDSQNDTVRATLGKRTGKWFWEVTLDVVGASIYNAVCVTSSSLSLELTPGGMGSGASYHRSGLFESSETGSETLGLYVRGQTVSVALDADEGVLYFAVDGIWQNASDPSRGLNPLPSGVLPNRMIYPCLNLGFGYTYTANFGQRPFVAEVPEGFEAGFY